MATGLGTSATFASATRGAYREYAVAVWGVEGAVGSSDVCVVCVVRVGGMGDSAVGGCLELVTVTRTVVGHHRCAAPPSASPPLLPISTTASNCGIKFRVF